MSGERAKIPWREMGERASEIDRERKRASEQAGGRERERERGERESERESAPPFDQACVGLGAISGRLE